MATNAGIARQIGVSEETVRRRLKRMVEEQYIRVVALPDPGKLGYNSEVLVGIQVDPAMVDSVADALAGLNEVNWVSVTTGSFDIFAWATLRSSEELSEFLRKKVGVITGVRKMETFLNLDMKKRRYGIAI
jgi:Lrp/AsnC family transcriptional regulator for asnA, asnC and gidA